MKGGGSFRTGDGIFSQKSSDGVGEANACVVRDGQSMIRQVKRTRERARSTDV